MIAALTASMGISAASGGGTEICMTFASTGPAPGSELGRSAFDRECGNPRDLARSPSLRGLGAASGDETHGERPRRRHRARGRPDASLRSIDSLHGLLVDRAQLHMSARTTTERVPELTATEPTLGRGAPPRHELPARGAPDVHKVFGRPCTSDSLAATAGVRSAPAIERSRL